MLKDLNKLFNMATLELGNVPSIVGDSGWTEPESAANTSYQPIYPYNDVKQTESGHLFEMDDTPTRERIRLQHGKTLTFIEFHPNGDQVHKVFGDDYEITIKNKNVLIKGDCNITVNGDCNMQVKGNHNLDVVGDYNIHVGGKMNTRVRGDMTVLTDSDLAIQAGENFNSISLAASDVVQVRSDLNVAGAIQGDIITSKTRVDAGTGVRAGPLGFVSLTGGLAVGFPVASFGDVRALKSGTFGVSVTTSSLTSLFSTTIIGGSIWESDVVNYILRLTHAPKGTTEISAG
jgi:hypothetical protein